MDFSHKKYFEEYMNTDIVRFTMDIIDRRQEIIYDTCDNYANKIAIHLNDRMILDLITRMRGINFDILGARQDFDEL